jgi:type I restriction enzyme, S subunit
MNKQKEPKLRFPGFTDQWQEKRLGDVAEINPKTQKLPDEFIYIDLESVESGKLLKENVITSDNAPSRAQRVLRKDDILFQMVRPYQRNNLYFDLKDEIKKYVASTGYAQLRPKDQPKFIYHYMHTNRFVNEVLDKCTGTSYPAINSSDLGAIKVAYPTHTEQKRIAEFLSDIDTKIEKLTLKKELTEQYKKGAMQKIFSQKIRFKDEKGKNYPDWEEKRLGEVCNNFIVPMRDKPKDLTGSIPWCRIEDFEGKYLYRSKSNQGVNSETIKEMNLKVYPVNTLLVSCSANLGFCAITKRELVTNQTFIGLVADDEKANIEYLYYTMILSSLRLNVLSSGTTITYLSRNEFENFMLDFPCLEEQKKISDFLIDLDTKIQHIDKELVTLKEFKKGLLQGMFV